MAFTSLPSHRIRHAGMPMRAGDASARDADRALIALAGPDYLDTTHFDTVRFPPPRWAAGRFAAASRDGSLAYTPYRGSENVRANLAVSLSAWLGNDVDHDRELLLTPGTQAGLFVTLSALVNPGDRVVLIDPDYLFSERILAYLGARVHHVPLHLDAAAVTPDLDLLEQALATPAALLLFSHPNNPTGAVYPPAVLQRIADLADASGTPVVVDELYARLVYDATPYVHFRSLPRMREQTVTLLGPSKTESLSGYRLGVVVGPPQLVDAAEDVLSLAALRAPGYAQHVLTGWLTDDREWIHERVRELYALRALTAARLAELPWIGVRPQQGTAYLFPDVSALGLPDRVVAERLITAAGVLVSPGYQFGPRGTGHFRVCYARDEVIWDAALTRIVETLDKLATETGQT